MGLGTLIEKLGELAEKGKELHGLKEFGDRRVAWGLWVYDPDQPGKGSRRGSQGRAFGNVRTDEKTGRATVHEVIEPPVDVFEEPGHVLVVAELPGVGEDDLISSSTTTS